MVAQIESDSIVNETENCTTICTRCDRNLCVHFTQTHTPTPTESHRICAMSTTTSGDGLQAAANLFQTVKYFVTGQLEPKVSFVPHSNATC